MYEGVRCSIVTWVARAGQGRDERDRRRPAPDDHHRRVGTVEVVGPVLGVDDRPLETIDILEIGDVAPVVAVVAAAGEQEAAGELDRRARVRALGDDVPPGGRTRPVGREDAVAEADAAIDALVPRGVLDVAADVVAVGDGLRPRPGSERVAQGEHVRVRAHPRVAKQVPGPPDGVPGLEDGVGRPRARRLQMVTGGDARQAGTDDEHVQMLGRGGGRHRRVPRRGIARRRTTRCFMLQCWAARRTVRRRRTGRPAIERAVRRCRGRRDGHRRGRRPGADG